MVVFKEGTAVHRGLSRYFDFLEEENIRGLGQAFGYFNRTSAYFFPIKRDFSLAGREVERSVIDSLGKHSVIVSIRSSDRLSIYPTGNISRSNPLLLDSFTPRSVSPTDPDLIGTLWLALYKRGLHTSILAVHDPPSNLLLPHVALEVPVNLLEEVFFALLASFRSKRVFVPHVTVSRSFEASYFYPLIKRRRVSAYHVPYAMAHLLDGDMFEQMREKGGVRSVLVEKGLVLPWELPQKEV